MFGKQRTRVWGRSAQQAEDCEASSGAFGEVFEGLERLERLPVAVFQRKAGRKAPGTEASNVPSSSSNLCPLNGFQLAPRTHLPPPHIVKV